MSFKFLQILTPQNTLKFLNKDMINYIEQPQSGEIFVIKTGIGAAPEAVLASAIRDGAPWEPGFNSDAGWTQLRAPKPEPENEPAPAKKMKKPPKGAFAKHLKQARAR